MNRNIIQIILIILVLVSILSCSPSKTAHVTKIRYELANHIPYDTNYKMLFVAMASECLNWGIKRHNADLDLTQRSTLCIKNGAVTQSQDVISIYNHLTSHFDTLFFMRLVGASCLGEGEGYRRRYGDIIPPTTTPMIEQCIRHGTSKWLSSPIL